MFVVDNLFIDGADYSKKDNEIEQQIYTPWDSEIYSFKKTPIFTFHKKKPPSRCRYASQLENYVNKSK